MIETFLKDALEHQSKQDYESARALFNKCILLDSGNHLPYFLIGNLEKDLGNIDKAIFNFQISIKHNANYINSYLNLSYLYIKNNNHKTAIEVLKIGISTNQDNIELRLQLSEIYIASGFLKEASVTYYEIVQLDSKNIYAIYRLIELGQKDLDKKLKKELKEYEKNNKLNNNQKIYSNLILAKYESNIDRNNKELQYLLEAHKLHYEQNKANFNSNNQFIFNKLKDIDKYFDPNIKMSHSSQIREKIRPIFIFGLPRTGSTLIEKMIIKDNSKYSYGEETRFFNMIADTIFFHKNENNLSLALEKIFIKYINKFKSHEGIYFFTDKTLNNFFFLGWIKKLFPNAKLIHCVRNPYIVTSSILRYNLSNLTWAHNLEDIIKYIDLYQEVILMWKKNYGINVYDIHYKNLINDFEFESKKLFDYCEIDWNDDLINFNKNNSYISQTASNIKVRSNLLNLEDEKHKSLANYLFHQINKPNWNKIN